MARYTIVVTPERRGRWSVQLWDGEEVPPEGTPELFTSGNHCTAESARQVAEREADYLHHKTTDTQTYTYDPRENDQ